MQEVIDVIKRHVRKDGFVPTSIPGLEVVRGSAPTQRIPAVYSPSLCYVLQGTKEVSISRKTFRYSAGQYLVSSVDLPVTGEVVEATSARPYLCLVVSLPAARIYDVLQSIARPPGGESMAGVYVGTAEAPLTDAVTRLTHCLDSSDDRRVLVPGITLEIIYRLLLGPFGSMIAAMGTSGSHTQRITRAIAHLKANFAEPLRVAELARLSSMSTSTFHDHFRRITTMSPLQYQKLLRLQEARRLLVADGLGAADIGFRVGYQSPSQFSREYKRLFGHPPSADVGGRTKGKR